MKQKVYSARKFLQKSTKELKAVLSGKFPVVFDDGKIIEMTAHEVVVSSFFWDFHRQLTWLPLNSTHSINSAIGKGLMNNKTHLKLFTRIFWDIMDQADARGKPLGYEDIDKVNEMIYRKNSEIYNFATTELEEFTISVDNDDYCHVAYYPPIKAITDRLNDGIPSDEDISLAYTEATEILTKDPYFDHNETVIAARSAVTKMNQFLQVIIYRGNVTDIDSMIFADPSQGNFANGFKNFYSLFIDTRTAAKALFFSGKLLRDSEYNSRRLQFLCQSVETVYPGDCGSTKFLPFKLKPDVRNEEGKVVVPGDFERWLGKYFEDPDTNEIKELKPDDTKYIGQVLKFRSIVAGCAHPDPHGICQTCWTSMSRVIPPSTNIGWMVVAALMQILNQSILAVKHVDSSSSSNSVVLDQHHARLLTVNSEGNSYKFNPALKGQRVTLEVSEEQLPSAATILGCDDFSIVSPSQLSELTSLYLITGDPDGVDYQKDPIILTYEKRNPFFTVKALEWIKEKGYTKTEKGNFYIDFTDWPLAEPFAQLPARHFNNADHAKDIADLIQGKTTNVQDRKKRKQDGSVIEYFQDFYNLVTSRLPHVPAAVMEIIILGASIRSSADNDYRVPKAHTTREMGLSGSTVPFRSMGAAVGSEHLTRELFSSTNGYEASKTSSHAADVFVCPAEAIEDFKNRSKKFGRVSESEFADPV